MFHHLRGQGLVQIPRASAAVAALYPVAPHPGPVPPSYSPVNSGKEAEGGGKRTREQRSPQADSGATAPCARRLSVDDGEGVKGGEEGGE